MKILVDAHTPSHLFFTIPYIEDKEFDILWHGDEETLEVIRDFFELNGKVFHYKVNHEIKKKWIFKKKELNKYRSFLERNIKDKDYYLYTSFNSGSYFYVLQKYLNIENHKIFLFDDGMASFMKLKNTNRFLKFLLFLFQGIIKYPPKHKLFADPSTKNGVSINSKLAFIGNNKKINFKSNNKQVKDAYNYFFNKKLEDFYPNSAIVLSHHSIESGRMSPARYFGVIENVKNQINELGFKNIYIKTHHLERKQNLEKYEEMGFRIFKNQNIPIEVSFFSENLSLIAQPYNSAVFIGASLGLLSNKKIISYHLENLPYYQFRKKSINEICDINKIEHLEI
tara:strand:- start:4445 stop:5461 length:1017 start_codon:yes stop_codon:yes gene_type:complete